MAAVVYSTAAKNARLQVIADLVAGKTIAAATGAASAGQLVIQDSAGGTLATIALPVAPFSISFGVATLLGVPLRGTASAGGVATKAELRNSSGVAVGSQIGVGIAGSGAPIILDSVALTAGQFVVVTAGTITHG